MPVDELLSLLDEQPFPTEDDSTEDGQDPEEQENYGENNEELPEELRNALKEIVKTYQMQDQYDRRREIMNDWANRLYDRGLQHLQEIGSQGGYAVASPGSWTTNSAGERVQCPSAMKDYNIFSRYLLTVTAVLTQNSPGVDFQPDDPGESEDVEATKTAEAYREDFNRKNEIKSLQMAMVRMLGLSGRTITYTRTETDDGDPHETLDVFGTIESKLSITAKTLKQTPYVILSDDLDADILKGLYPQFADKIQPGKAGIAENNYERLARLGVMSGTRTQGQVGETMGHVTTRQRCFLRPCAFLRKSFKGDGTQEQLQQLFPNGARVCFVGGEYVGSWAESIEDHIAVDFPYSGDGMCRAAMMDVIRTIQDDFNDGMNACWEVGEYGWPIRWQNGETEDQGAVTDQKASPYASLMKKARGGQALEAEFYQEPDPNIPATIWNWLMTLMNALPQFLLAAPPSLQGDSSPDLKTASAYSQARAQAMGQQGIPWMAIQRLWAKVYWQAAKCAFRRDKDGDGKIVVPGKAGTTSIYQLAQLKGDFGCYPDQDSSFPESTQAKRANLMQILQFALQSPQVGQQLLASPDNWELFKNDLGTPDLVLPEAEARDKQLAEIEVLLENSPLPADPMAVEAALLQAMKAHTEATLMGQQVPPFDANALKAQFEQSMMTPSVPVGEFDYHEYEITKIRDYLTSSEARRVVAAKGLDYPGLKNLVLHLKAHIVAKQKLDIELAPLAPPMPALPPPAAHKGKPPAVGSPHPTAAPNGAANGAPSL